MHSKRYGPLALLAATLLAMTLPAASAQSQGRAAQADTAQAALRVMSFNLRLNTPADSADAWPNRKDAAASVVRFHEADLVGVQEAQRGMLADLKTRLPGFEWLGEPRADGDLQDEYSAIFYRTSRLQLGRHGTFWLSETPEVQASTGWDAALPRIATWAELTDLATGQAFYHFNTHFDHRGDTARAESARLLRRRIAEIAGDAPVVVTGDFNAEPEAEPYRLLTTAEAAEGAPLRDALMASETNHHGPRSTWNGFDQIEPGRRIDFIFTTGGVRVLRHGILTDVFDGGRFPSDHLPVLAEIVFAAEQP